MTAVSTFAHAGRTYIEMNGKTFQALRLFGDGHRSAVSLNFALLIGRAPLAPADLPDPKKFALIRSKTQSGVAYTVYRKDRFAYDATTGKMLFVAPTLAGAWFIALRQLTKIHSIDVTEAQVADVAEQIGRGEIDRPLGWDAKEIEDRAGGEPAILIDADIRKTRLTKLFNIPETADIEE